jgi:hypothetical protein
VTVPPLGSVAARVPCRAMFSTVEYAVMVSTGPGEPPPPPPPHDVMHKERVAAATVRRKWRNAGIRNALPAFQARALPRAWDERYPSIEAAEGVATGISAHDRDGDMNKSPCGEKSVWVLRIGGPCRDRTYDQEIKSLLLYQLS